MGSVAKAILRRDGMAWRWYVIDYDQTVATGRERNWSLAQRSAERARREYVSKLSKNFQ